MNTSKRNVQIVVAICRSKGIRKVVFSPGSRSAPFVIEFSQVKDIECMVIPDERVAGYFALGMAQQLQETVAVVCTSGTAALNLLPAAAEASYQEIPLLFITADRPAYAYLKGENQAIDQEGVFANFAADYSILEDDTEEDIIEKTEDAIFVTTNRSKPARLNVHIDEPLYETEYGDFVYKPTDTGKAEMLLKMSAELRAESKQKFAADLRAAQKKLIVIGLHKVDDEFTEQIAALAERSDCAVLVESTSNISVEGAIHNYDSCVAILLGNKSADFVPDMVITFGKQIISKRIRQFLRKNKPTTHWHIPPHGEYSKVDHFELNQPPAFIRENEALELLQQAEDANSGYSELWSKLDDRCYQITNAFLDELDYCDLRVFDTLLPSFPEGANIQYGNSTPVRYSNFFVPDGSHTINSNRGTSGIDGCLSTAAGAAYVNNGLTIAVLGDVSFFYDSNALWNNYLSPNLRIIIINNSGGNIFRLISGPDNIRGFEQFFETRHNLTAKHLAGMYGLPYYFCAAQKELDETLEKFYAPHEKAAILEIKTDGELSALAFKEYYGLLANTEYKYKVK